MTLLKNIPLNIPLRLLFVVLFALIVFTTIAGYATFVGQRSLPQQAGSGSRLIVCSTTQIADFARNVVGDRWQVRSVLAPGQDPHLYEIKPGDAALVARAELCLENGWHLEGKDWMHHLADQAGRPIVTCVEGIEPYRLVEDGTEVHDPHAWFTPTNALIFVDNIHAAVVRLDPEHASEYDARAQLYRQQLQQLDGWIRSQFEQIPHEQRVLVTSHDAFNYFCREYDLKAASPTGWSTGEEVGGGATPERRKLVVESIRQLGVKALFVETSVNAKMITVIAEESGVRIGGRLYSDSMGPPGSGGETYLGMMRENVLTIVEALR